MGDGLLQLVPVDEPGDPKVRYLGDSLVIKQDVVGLDVAVDDLGAANVVQVLLDI